MTKKFSQEFILEHINTTHPDKYDIPKGDLCQTICQYDYFILEEIPVKVLAEHSWFINDDLIEHYLNTSELPPVVIGEDFSIIDGLHQIKVARLKNQRTLFAYRGFENPKK